jgi:signal transduction histidine kinase
MSTRERAGGAGSRASGRGLRKRGSALRDLSVSRRLIAVIVLALIMGLVFGGLRVADAVGSADQFGRVAQLASLGEQVTILTQDLQNERDETAAVIGGVTPKNFDQVKAATSAAAAKTAAAANDLGGGFPANIESAVATVAADTGNLATVRSLARAEGNPTSVITDYANVIGDMTALTGEIAQGVSDSTLSNDVRTLNAISAVKEQAAEQRALVFNALTAGFFGINVQTAVSAAAAQQQLDVAAFQTTATQPQQAAFASVFSSQGASDAANIESFLLSDGEPFNDIGNLGIKRQDAPQTWYSDMSAEIGQMQGIELKIAADIVARAKALQNGATGSALTSAIIVAVVLFLVLVAALIVARSVVRPLRRLRAGALDVASVQLPARIKQLSESQDPAESMEVAPISVLTTDEIGQVARAFDQVHAEAVRLAGNEAVLRTAFNAMFVNLSRRSQSLIERLARMIESLEQNEDDPDRLSSLFSIDHLVTRMRRNSENLLLLAGHESPRKWSEPVPLADVTRAAISEIEQYNRVVLNVQPGVAVIGQAVSDIVHLFAELIENATTFSPKDTQVMVTAQDLTSGGVLIEISDKGIGVSESRLEEMNWRLDNPPVMDVTVSRHMGLFAVARLAERHRVRVRLRPGNPQGLTALVWLPDTVIERSGRSVVGAGARQVTARGAGGFLQSRRASGQHTIAAGSQHGSGKHSITRPVAGIPPTPDREEDVAEPAQSGKRAAGSQATGSQATSNWFRSRHTAMSAARMPVNAYDDNGAGAGAGEAAGGTPSRAPAQQGGGWGPEPGGSTPGGRRPVDVVAEPVLGEQTSAGLPMRIPKANLIPGSAGGARGGGGGSDEAPTTLSAPLPQRSPELAASRLSGFQRGARRAEGQTRAGKGTDR